MCSCSRAVQTLLTVLWIATQSSASDRVEWNTSRVVGKPEPPKPYAVSRIYPELEFQQPVELVPLGSSGKMLLLEVGGKVFTFDDSKECKDADLAFDLAAIKTQFMRAYAICPHPNFDENRKIFICYAHNPVARPDGTKLSSFTLEMTETPTIDPASEEILLTWASGGHNGCAIRFDDEGYLYFSAGDGARPYPPDEYNVSQDLSDLRSTICRIDVDRREDGRGYAIPSDNPFVDFPNARPEIWAFGFRNPWRFSIDPVSQKIFCGDVGWELWELLFLVERGGNYGWSIFEGPQPIRSDIQQGPGEIIKPLVAYPHTEGLSITGGFTYRGSDLPELAGQYIYGDYVTGLIWGMTHKDGNVQSTAVLSEAGIPIISFCETRDHEILVLSYEGGIYKLIENPEQGRASNFPKKLSETGLFASMETLETALGVYPYTARHTAFRDGATSEFAVGVPGSETIRTGRQKRNWNYPKDTVFSKTLSLDVAMKNGQSYPRRVETQILHYDGATWQPYCYVWNEEQTDAHLISSAGDQSEFQVLNSHGEVETLNWRHHSQSECRACHIKQTGGALAFSYENLGSMDELAHAGDLNHSNLSASKAEVRSQVDWFVELSILDKRAPQGWNIQQMVAADQADATLEQRARSYLAANCAHCHCRGGGGTVALDLLYNNATGAINAVDFSATQGTFGLDAPKVIVPGAPERSVMYYRMATSGKGHMPKLWTRQNDEAGLKLIHEWISSMPSASAGPTAGSDDAKASSTTSVALQDFHRLLSSPAEVRSQVAEQQLKSGDLVVQGIFERFVAPDKRKKRLGNHINSDAILKLSGNSTSGEKLFADTQISQCNKCHRVGGSGQMIGPDLTDIAKKRSPEQLLKSILDPSAEIDPQFTTHAVLTFDGQIVTGLKLEGTADSTVLRSADGKTHTIPNEDIDQITRQTSSLMPVGLAAEMTAQELADLLAYLSSLKGD